MELKCVLKVDPVSAEAVFEKHCVPHTAPCQQGPRGDNGTSGDPGLNGPPGTDGQSGSKGSEGEPGIPGLKGSPGPMGAKGDNGTNGYDALPGDTGSWGDTGDRGVNGEPGLKGDTGDTGIKGDVGDIGLPGRNGSQGISGLKGDPGDIGIAGANGTQGPQGPNGTDVRKFADGCQCYTKPSFDYPYDETVFGSSTSQIMLPCEAHGNPSPTVSLRRPLRKPGQKRDVTHVGNTYVINQPTNNDFGQYICEATNVYGTVSKTVNLISRST